MDEKYPLVSIVTPSYNKGQFIEKTIASIKMQAYPNIEHIVVDGGSSDNTLEVLKKYDNSIKWISEPDKGQSDAINKGWRMARGQILAYLNADDVYTSDAVDIAVKFLLEHPDLSLVYGDSLHIDERDNLIKEYHSGGFDINRLICCDDNIPQPTVFFKREVLDKVGYIDESLNLAMDLDFLIRAGLKFNVGYIPKPLAAARYYAETKTISQSHKFVDDFIYILDKTYSRTDLPEEIIRLKRRAYSSAYLYGGASYFQILEIKKARESFLKAYRLYPLNVLKDPMLLLELIISLFGKNVATIVVKCKRKIV